MAARPPPPQPQMLQVNNLNRLNALTLLQEQQGQQEQQQNPAISVTSHQHPLTIHDLEATFASSKLNPRNASPFALISALSLTTFLAFLATFTGAIYAPAQSTLSQSPGFTSTTTQDAILPLSMYNLGLAFGPLIGAPLSETYGRKAVFLVTAFAFAAFTLGAGFSENLTQLIVTRFFAGMFASPLVNNASAVILDSTDSRYRGMSLGIYYAFPSFGTGLAPLIGGFIVDSPRLGWRWTQHISVILTVAAFIPVCFTRETYKKVILQRESIRLGLQDTSSTRMGTGRAIRYFATTLIQRPLHMLFTEPIVMLVSLYNGFLFGLMYAFIVASPWMYETYYGFGKNAVSLTFLGLSLGALLASVPLALTDLYMYQPRLTKWRASHGDADPVPPENRLFASLAGSIILPPSLFMVGWATHYKLSPILPIVFQGVVNFSSILVYGSVNLFMLDAYGPLYGASASGAMMLTRYAVSTVFPLFSLQMYQKLGVGWATSLLGFVTVLMAPIPWWFKYYGPKLRAKSRYEMSQ